MWSIPLVEDASMRDVQLDIYVSLCPSVNTVLIHYVTTGHISFSLNIKHATCGAKVQPIRRIGQQSPQVNHLPFLPSLTMSKHCLEDFYQVCLGRGST